MATAPRLLHRDRRTLDAIFRHPLPGNLAWSDVLHLIERLGAVRHEPNGRLLLTVSERKHVLHEPRGKELTPEEVTQVRKFLEGAGVTPATMDTAASSAGEPGNDAGAAAAATHDMLVAVDHHRARIFTIDESSGTTTLRPYDPHHFLHHLTHRQERELRGQREPEEPAYYQQIAAALGSARRIVMLGHGTGHSNAAAHLEEVLRSKHPAVAARIVAHREVDLSAVTEPQLLAQALELLDAASRSDRSV